jgi:membrane protease YdiL (CAAX protease family)
MSRRREKGPALPRAIKAAQAGELERARELLQQVLAEDPESQFARLWLDRVLEQRKETARLAKEATGRTRIETPRTLAVVALVFLVAVALAELLTTWSDPRLGLALHGLILVGLFVASMQTGSRDAWVFVLSLAFAPLIRILSMSMPLTRFPLLYWYLITSVPLFAAVWAAGRSLGYSWRGRGLTLRGWPLQVVVGASGLALGAAEYLILRPEPLAPELSWAATWQPALILFVCTGLLEELIFRGLLQRSAADTLGRWAVPYVAMLFAVLHVGYKSLLDVVFVLIVGLYFGWVVERTRSLLGVTLAHGLTNIMLFLVMPFVI